MNIIENIITSSPIVQGGLTLMVAGWAGYQLREIPARISRTLRATFTRVVQVRDRNPHYDAWLGLVTDGAVRKGGPRTLEARTSRSEIDNQEDTTRFAAGTDRFWSRVCGVWCRVTIQREDRLGGPRDLSGRHMLTVEAVGASRADLERMLGAARARADGLRDCQLVDLCGKYGSTTTMAYPKRDKRTLCLPKGLFEGMETRMSEFLASQSDYEHAGIPWRFGLLLHGEPGTGKTSIAHALASSLSLRLAVIPLADLGSDEELVSSFEGVRDRSIVLIEDVDCAFRKRQNEDAGGITFSGLLNCIDGMLAPHNGRILVMSTNHIDRLDPALIRPGRIDLRVEVPILDQQSATDYVDRVFPHVSTRHDLVKSVLSQEHPTPAALINAIVMQDWRRPSTSNDRDTRIAQARGKRDRSSLWRRERRTRP